MNEREEDKRSVDDILQGLIRINGWQKQLDLYSIFSKWSELVAGDISEHARPVKIERDVLWLEVENSSWMAEFSYYKLDILERVNDSLSLGRIRDVKMALPKKGRRFIPAKPATGPKVIFESLDPELVEAFERKTSFIADEDCRQSLMNFWYIANACKRLDE